MQVFLTKPDRERYGLPDGLLEVDLYDVFQDEAEELDAYGVDPDEGWIPFLNSNDIRVWRIIVWLALRRAGVEVSLTDVKFNRRRTGYVTPDESPGKGDSETSDAPTPPPSSDDSPDSPSET